MERNKALNLIKLLDLLSLRTKTTQQIAATLGVGVPQVKRYYHALEGLHLSVDHDDYGRCFVYGAEELRKSLLLEQEKAWVCSQLQLHAPDHPYTHSISQKLSPKDLPFPLPHQIKDANLGNNFEKISYALKHGLQIELINYHSAKNPIPKPLRVVEPLQYKEQHRHLEAWDLEVGDVRTFKIDRMEKVNLLETPLGGQHKSKRFIDAFGFNCDRRRTIKLRLSPLARDLMVENHPLARPYISVEGKDILFQGPVCSNIGIGRFILGLPNNVKLLYGPELKAYLQEQLAFQRF